MDFKVGVSLWNQASLDDRQQQPIDMGRSANFRDKLALNNTPQQTSFEQVQPIVAQPLSSTFQLRPPPSLGAEAYQRLEALDSTVARTDSTHSHGQVEAVELYALGALAGHHLSQSPDLFTSSARAETLPGSATTAASSAAPMYGSRLTPQAERVSAVQHAQPPEQLFRHTAQEADVVSSPARRLESHLSTQWPDRRVQVIARGEDETELLVRDYHLDAEEQDALVADLRRHVTSMPKQPAQVWLNGQSIWQNPIAAHKE